MVWNYRSPTNVKLAAERKTQAEDVYLKKKKEIRKIEFEQIRELSVIETLHFSILTSYCCANIIHFSQRIYYLFEIPHTANS